MEVTTAVLEAFQCEPINYYKAIPCCETVKDYRMKYCFFCRLKMCFERLRDEQSEVNFESCPDVMPWIPCREPRAAICAASSGEKKTCFKLYTVGRLDPVSLKKNHYSSREYWNQFLNGSFCTTLRLCFKTSKRQFAGFPDSLDEFTCWRKDDHAIPSIVHSCASFGWTSSDEDGP